MSKENLITAWYEFKKGKRRRVDIQAFELNLENSIFALSEELANGHYLTDNYHQFRVNDPKPRLISKATVRDRLVHHAIYRILYPLFDQIFIYDSYSCRNEKGTHKAFARLEQLTRRCNKNHTQPCFALKCDIRKFFDSVDHDVLLKLLAKRVTDDKLLDLLEKIIKGFSSKPGKGMPIGNLTSQLFANVCMDPLDKFIIHQLNIKFYVRYADDFLILASDKDELMGYFVEIRRFLKENLCLDLRPNKISLRKLEWGIDFVGYVARPHYAVPRRKTVKRMMRNITHQANTDELSATLASYLGYVSHVNAYKLSESLKDAVYNKLIS